MNSSISIEVIGAGVALVLILIIAFTVSRAKKRGKSEGGSDLDSIMETPREPVIRFVVAETLIDHSPLGGVPGTGLDAGFITLAGSSLAAHIATVSEGEDALMWRALSDGFNAPREALDGAGDAPANSTPVTGMEMIEFASSAEGFAARISFDHKKYTLLFGDATPVAQASAPFSDATKSFVERNLATFGTKIFVIDGIAYGAISVNRTVD